jgi:hypothetical protein
MLAMIPNELQTTTTGSICGPIGVNIIAKGVIIIVKISHKERDADQVELCTWIVNGFRNLIHMSLIVVVNKLKTNSPSITILSNTGGNCLNPKGFSPKVGEERPLITDDARG